MTRGQPDGEKYTRDFMRAIAIFGLLMFALPVALGVFMLVVTPSYFRPLLTLPIGAPVLAGAVVLTALNGLIVWVEFKMVERGHLVRVLVLTVAGTLFVTFPNLWLILLGPALVIVAQRSP